MSASDDADDSGGSAADAGEDEGFWKIDLEDVEETTPQTLEPGRPDPENVVFIVLGVVLAIAFLWSAM